MEAVFALFVFTVFVVLGLDGWLLVRWLAARWRHQPRAWFVSKPALALHAATIAGLLCIGWGALVEPGRIEVSRVRVHTPELSRAKIRIVQISDLHADLEPGNEMRLPELINPLEPDLIVFTGDALNDPKAKDRLRQVLSQLQASMAKLAVAGNFDSGDEDLFAGTGFTSLRNESLVLEKDGDRLIIFGVSAFTPSDTCVELIERAPTDGYRLLLAHYPDQIEETQSLLDLYLAGHTHGGQVRLPFYGAMITLARHGKKYEAGFYHVGAANLYVNRGLGMEPFPAPRVRFLCRPEIAVFDLAPLGAFFR